MTDLKWEDPPADSSGRPGSARHSAIAAELKANPGRWALVRSDCKSRQTASMAALHIRRGTTVAFQPAGSFEATSRRTGETFGVYVRYVGEPS